MTSLLLLLALLLSLAACGKGESEPSGRVQQPGELVPGWLAEEVRLPEEVGWITQMDLCDSVLYISWMDRTNHACLGCYNTTVGDFRQLPLDTADRWRSELHYLSVADGVAWGLVESFAENWSDRRTDLLYCDTQTGEAVRVVPIPIQPADAGEMGAFFQGLYALDGGRALLYDAYTCYEIGPDCAAQRSFPREGLNLNFCSDDGQRLLVSQFQNDGANIYHFCDPETLTPLEEVALEGFSHFRSENGRILVDWEQGVCELDPATGSMTPLFKWMDVAPSSSAVGGGFACETATGELWYPSQQNGVLIRVHEAMIPYQEPLRLAVFSSGPNPDSLIRFNHSGLPYKIEVTNYWGLSEQERQRVMIELATGGDFDLIDTSGLPEGSLDGGMLTDLLPYIDADPDLSREDFIQPLLSAMLRDGGLYELSPRWDILTFAAHGSQFPGRADWTIGYVNQLVEDRGQMPVFFWHRNREVLTDLMAKMATAEFIDWGTGECRFDSPEFKAWLRLVKEIPYDSDYTDSAVLLVPVSDAAGYAGYMVRSFLRDADYVYAGFPSSSGNGSYFIRLGTGSDAFDGTKGDNVSLGIPASSAHKDGAWLFLRQLLLTTGDADYERIDYGIPVLKDTFEGCLARSVQEGDPDDYYTITQADAEKLRQLVYGTERLAHTDEALLSIIKTEAANYYAGYKTLDEAAALIQSRASLYMSEQYG